MELDEEDEGSLTSKNSQEDLQPKKRRQRGGNTQDSRTRRLEKNRESARESRKRKKNYIEQLEGRADELQAQVDELKRQMEVYKEKEKMVYLNQIDSVDTLLQGRQILIKQLESSVTNEEFSSINSILAAIREKSGSFGSERKNIVNDLFRRIIEVQVPSLVKYLFWSAENNKGIFNNKFLEEAIKEGSQRKKKYSKYQIEEMRLSEQIDEWDEINYELNLSVDQYMILKREQDFVTGQKKKFNNLFDQLLQIKNKLNQENAYLDQTLERMRQVLNPEQQARMLVIFEKMKDRKEVSIFNLWNIKKLKKPETEAEVRSSIYALSNEVGLVDSDDQDEGQLPVQNTKKTPQKKSSTETFHTTQNFQQASFMAQKQHENLLRDLGEDQMVTEEKAKPMHLLQGTAATFDQSALLNAIVS